MAYAGQTYPFFLSARDASDPRPKLVPFPDPVGQSAGVWQGIFRDEFDDGTKPDRAVWCDRLIEGDGFRCNDGGEEIQWYTHDRRGVSVGNSCLSLIARNESPYTADPLCPNPMPGGNVGSWTSGMVQSHPSFQMTYGYAEASIKHPPTALGQWPAWWSSNADGQWPPEWDFAEFFDGNTVKANFDNEAGTWTTNVFSYTPGGFDVWGCKWDSAGTTWYKNGSQFATVAQTSTVPQHLILNFAIRTTTVASGPWSCDIDYVRAWNLIGTPAKPVISAISPSNGVPSAGSIAVTFGAVSGATSYRVTACPVDALADGVTTGTTHSPATGASSPLTVTGLTNGARYTVSAAAINATGYSPESALAPVLSW